MLNVPSFLLPFLLATNNNPPPTSTSTTSSVTTKRQFQFVNYGESFSSSSIMEEKEKKNRPTISCDGRIPGGVTLELTHWNGNETPDSLYRDTSTGMALVLAKAGVANAPPGAKSPSSSSSPSYYADLTSNAYVLNNHFDTDGVLSVWACLEPELALQHGELLIQGAEAGDFGEWSSDLGIKLDSALLELCDHCPDEETAFWKAFEVLPNLLKDLKTTGGKSYEELWKPGFDDAMQSWNRIQNEEITIEPCNNNNELVVVKRPASISSISPFALHRDLVEKGLDASVKRVLHVTTASNGNQATTPVNSYQYEKAGHGWVSKLVQRPMVPSVDSTKLVENLNSALNTDDAEGQGEEPTTQWKAGGSSLVSICQTIGKLCTQLSVEEVTAALLEYDEGISVEN